MSQEYREKLYSEYSSQRQLMHAASLEAAGRYDRAVLTIATGAIALSLLLLEAASIQPSPLGILLLSTSWMLLLSALICELLALSCSQKACQRQIEILDEEYGYYLHSDDPEETVRTQAQHADNQFSRRTRRYSAIALSTLIVGISFMLLFSIVHIYQ